MKTRIVIDPNVRVRKNQTFAGFEDVFGIPVVGGLVEVVEVESGVTGPATVTEIDHDRNLVYLAVEWAALRRPEKATSSGLLAIPSCGQITCSNFEWTGHAGISWNWLDRSQLTYTSNAAWITDLAWMSLFVCEQEKGEEGGAPVTPPSKLQSAA